MNNLGATKDDGETKKKRTKKRTKKKSTDVA